MKQSKMQNQLISKLLLISVFLINSSCHLKSVVMSSKEVSEYHLIINPNVDYGYKPNFESGMVYKYVPPTPIIKDCNQIYLGKIILYDDGHLEKSIVGNENYLSDLAIKLESFIKDGIREVYPYGLNIQNRNKYYFRGNYKFDKNKIEFLESLSMYLNTLPYRTIKKEVGEKYLKNKWSKSIGSELINSIEYRDVFPFDFYGFDGDKNKCSERPKS